MRCCRCGRTRVAETFSECPCSGSFAAPHGSEKPRREGVAWQLETALKELSYGNLLNVMVHSQRAAAMALELCEARRGSPNDQAEL